MFEQCYSFDEFVLDVDSCELRRSGIHLNLERIPMQLLILLLENPGKLVRRELIIERLWGGNVFVEAEHSINTAINKLRSTLRDDSRNPRFIRTVVGQGYCFIAKVNVLEPVHVPANALSLISTNPRESEVENASITSNGHSVNSVVTEEPDVAENNSYKDVTVLPLSEQPVAAITKKITDRQVRLAILFTGLLIVLLGIVGAVYLTMKKGSVARSQPEAATLHSVAILPFRNLAQTADQDYLVDGMTDQLTTELAHNTSLRVISQRSAMQYKGVQKPIQEIARALNVDAIVEGSYIHDGKQVRITAQLLDARNDQHIWAQTYEESDKNLFAVQDQVTTDIAQQVAIALGSRLNRSALRPINPQARNAYLRGRYFWNQRTLPAVKSSISYYTTAIREDPNYADAYAALAQAYVLLSVYGDSDPSDSFWKAQYAAERALDLNSRLGEAHTALAAVRIGRDWDWEAGEKEYQLALQLNSDDATSHHWYSLHLSRMGKLQEAEVEIQRAIALDPLSLMINADAAQTAYWARNPDEALSRVNGVLALNHDFAEAHLMKGKILELLHRYTEAIDEFQRARLLFGGEYSVDSLRAHALALSGHREEALALVHELEEKPPLAQASGASIALIYCALGQTDDAMKRLNLAYSRHDRGMNEIGIDPLYDGCRADSRFIDLLKRIRLPSSVELASH